MKKSIKGILIISVFVFSTLAASLIALGVYTQKTDDPTPLRLGPEFYEKKYSVDPSGLKVPAASSLPKAAQASYFGIGDLAYWLILNDYTGFYEWAVFELRGIGDQDLAELWVQTDLSYHPNSGRDPDVITDEQVTYMLGEFENNIYPKETAYFGEADYHNGSLGTFDTEQGLPDDYWAGSSRQVILVSNIRDVLFYEADASVYIAGFYSPTFQNFMDRNIMTIDSLRWDVLTGDPYYQYEGTFAHEYQHLLHSDYLPGDETFINEGSSMFAELLTGYPAAYGEIEIFFQEPDNSLTEWGDMGGGYDILADYGQALLFATYMVDQFGPNFLADYFANMNPGIDGLEALFPDGMTFEDVVHDWTLANLIHSDHPGHGKYNYKSLDLDLVAPISRYDLSAPVYPDWAYGTGFGETAPFGPTGVVKLGPYGTDYINLNDMSKFNFIFFDGDSEAELPPPPEWTLNNYVPFEDLYLPGDDWWWSGSADLINVVLASDVSVSAADPYLRFETYFDIEPQWDYGFVQVSTDNGATWTSLPHEYAWIPPVGGAHPDVLANQPGLTYWSPYFSGVYVTPMEYNLTAYADQDVMIGFRMVSDWSENYDNWYIRGAEVSGVESTLYNYHEPVEVDWMVSLVTYNAKGKVQWVYDFFMHDETDYGATLSFIANTKQSVILVITPKMSTGQADYGISTKPFKHGWGYWG